MITNSGKLIFLRGLTTEGQAFARDIALGVGTEAATATDTRLQFEVVRCPVDIIDYDSAAFELSVRAFVPDNFGFELHEVGLVVDEGQIDDEFISQVVSFFGDEDGWAGYDSVDTAASRMGDGGLRFDLASETKSVVSSDVSISFTTMENQDQLSLAYNLLSGSGTGVLRARTSATDYREYSFSLVSGYNVETFSKADFVEVGTAPWDEITDIYIELTGTASVVLDGLRTTSVRVESEILVSRTVLAAPVVKPSVVEMQLDYRIGVDFV